MGWFWGWGGRNNQNDPAKSLDNDLKQFLDEQQPRPYVPAEAPKAPETPAPKPPEQALPDTNKSFEDRALPKESLFQDGRYRDLWKTYVPQNEMAVATTTPVERVLAARKDRRQTIHKAALENCAFEEDIQQQCFKTSDLSKRLKGRMTMCHEETKAFNRCYTLQAKFLQALGYMTSSTTSDEDEEKIQMHADKLYHRMMDYEAEVDGARRENRPIPPLSSLFNSKRPAPTLEQMALPKPMEEKLKKPLSDYPPHERELVARAALQEAKLTDLYAEDLFTYTVTMNEDRKARQAWLTRTFGEAIGKFLIPDPPKDPSIKSWSIDQLQRDIWQEEKNAPASTKKEGSSSSQAK
ncbi:hypothetical protein H2202_000775 [Exophiala xenobiotica]|nr:hypothetical protein H2202_000775 [Exophiala xenobiotica]